MIGVLGKAGHQLVCLRGMQHHFTFKPRHARLLPLTAQMIDGDIRKALPFNKHDEVTKPAPRVLMEKVVAEVPMIIVVEQHHSAETMLPKRSLGPLDPRSAHAIWIVGAIFVIHWIRPMLHRKLSFFGVSFNSDWDVGDDRFPSTRLRLFAAFAGATAAPRAERRLWRRL